LLHVTGNVSLGSLTMVPCHEIPVNKNPECLVWARTSWRPRSGDGNRYRCCGQQSGEGWHGDCHRWQAYGMRVGILLLTSAVVGMSTTWFLRWWSTTDYVCVLNQRRVIRWQNCAYVHMDA